MNELAIAPDADEGAGGAQISRRKFLRLALLGTIGAVAAEALISFLGFFWPQKIGAFGGRVEAGTVADFRLNGAPVTNREGKFFISHVEEGLLAMYRKCTHLGCSVPDWNAAEGQFHCPCHGSLFDRHGRVTGGPAPRPLDLMEVEVVNGKVFVNTGKIIQRADWHPEQATKV